MTDQLTIALLFWNNFSIRITQKKYLTNYLLFLLYWRDSLVTRPQWVKCQYCPYDTSTLTSHPKESSFLGCQLRGRCECGPTRPIWIIIYGSTQQSLIVLSWLFIITKCRLYAFSPTNIIPLYGKPMIEIIQNWNKIVAIQWSEFDRLSLDIKIMLPS